MTNKYNAIEIAVNQILTKRISEFTIPFRSKLYPTDKDFIDFYVDRCYDKAVEVGNQVKTQLKIPQTDNVYDDDIFITVCNMIEPFIKYNISKSRPAMTDYANKISLLDWRL